MYREWNEAVKDIQDSSPKDLPEGRFNLAFPNSTCPSCKAAIRPLQNIPVISYLFLRGKCTNCNAQISKRYPIIEAITALLSFIVLWQLGPGWQTLAGLVFVWSLIALTMIDIDHKLLPDQITLPLLWLGLICNISNLYTDLNSAVIGAIAGYLSLWSVYWLFKLVTGKEGMGHGDFKLLAALGAWLGWQYLPAIIILSSFVGAIIGIGGILLAGRGRDYQMPFGPYLAIAGGLCFLWSEEVMHYYSALFSA